MQTISMCTGSDSDSSQLWSHLSLFTFAAFKLSHLALVFALRLAKISQAEWSLCRKGGRSGVAAEADRSMCYQSRASRFCQRVATPKNKQHFKILNRYARRWHREPQGTSRNWVCTASRRPRSSRIMTARESDSVRSRRSCSQRTSPRRPRRPRPRVPNAMTELDSYLRGFPPSAHMQKRTWAEGGNPREREKATAREREQSGVRVMQRIHAEKYNENIIPKLMSTTPLKSRYPRHQRSCSKNPSLQRLAPYATNSSRSQTNSTCDDPAKVPR